MSGELMAKGRNTHKEAQKNVSVYLGKKDEWPAEVLRMVTKITGESESTFFRKLFVERLQAWGVLDGTCKPVPEAMERLRERLSEQSTQLPPDLLGRGGGKT